MTEPGYLQSVYGRMRWFFSVQNQSSMKAQEREACNWCVQNLVADNVSNAVKLFHRAHEWSTAPFRLKLSVHDSVVVACRGEDVPYICETVMARCLATDNVVPALGFHFGIETGLHTRLSCHASEEELVEAGVPAGYWPKDCEAADVGPHNNPYPTAQIA